MKVSTKMWIRIFAIGLVLQVIAIVAAIKGSRCAAPNQPFELSDAAQFVLQIGLVVFFTAMLVNSIFKLIQEAVDDIKNVNYLNVENINRFEEDRSRIDSDIQRGSRLSKGRMPK